jgi:sugar (pentulose or hexulose) kinase
MLGRWDSACQRLELDELHRFSNDPVRVGGTLYWDILRLLHEIKQGLAVAARRTKDVAAIGIDTWGVDFALLDANGQLLQNPVHYRDRRTEGMTRAVNDVIPARALYAETGLQTMPQNTLYQLFALQQRQPELLRRAAKLLFLPDFLGYCLTGQMATELSIARTSQLLNVQSLEWSEELFKKLRLPHGLFAPLAQSGTALGALLPEVQEETGLGPVPVISVCGHDTQSAVCAVPSPSEDVPFAFLSSGTWSLLGTELQVPLVNDQSFRRNITNEGGMQKTRFLKNITGLWLLQESRRHWNRQGESYSFADLERLAQAAEPCARFINPDDPAFAQPGDLPARVAAFLARTGQPAAKDPGAVTRCIYDSLALKYRMVLENLQACTGVRYPCLHVIGGGVRDELLCQRTADACGIPVVAGPVEATVLGNIAVQMIARGALAGLAQARQVVAESYGVKTYSPHENLDAAYARFCGILSETEQHNET